MTDNDKYHLTMLANDDYNDKWQFFYAGLRYNTLFALYAKLKCNIEETNKTITRIDFKCVNYKGCINMGIAKVVDYDDNDGFRFKAQGMNPNRDAVCKGLKLDIPKGGRVIKITQELVPLGGVIGGTHHRNDTESIVFDEEFNFRNSINPEEWMEFKTENKMMYETNILGHQKDTIESQDGSVETMVVGQSCIRSSALVI